MAAASVLSSDSQAAAGAAECDAAVISILRSHVSGMRLRDFFWDVTAVTNHDTTDATVAQAVAVLEASTTEQRDLCIKKMTEYVETGSTAQNRVELEDIVCKILIAAHCAQLVSLQTLCEALISATDFKLETEINKAKFVLIRERINQLDYKGVRNLLKLLVLEKMQSIPASLTPYQRMDLEEVENLVIDIVDRGRNLLPALFVITELHRVTLLQNITYRAFTLPRIAEKFAQVFQSFRPLAEIVSIIGHPFLVPVSGHIAFSAMIANPWRLDPMTTKLPLRAQLPYTSEYGVPQSFVLYQVLRQPRGRDAIQHIIKPGVTTQGGQQRMSHDRYQYDEILQLIVLEAMAAMEKTDEASDDAICQYQWIHLAHTIVFSILHGNASLSRLLSYLKSALTVTPYRKGRGELIWTLLQFVSGAGQKISIEDSHAMFELYNMLYTGDEVWSGAGTDSVHLVRFMAPACLWLHLSQRFGVDNVPRPSDALRNHIQFLEDSLRRDDAFQDFMLAVMVNAYSTNAEIFQKTVLPAVQARWDSDRSDRPEDLWNLPLGRSCPKKLKPFRLAGLDAMTVHAKMSLLHVLSMALLQLIKQTNSRLPSPAAIGTFVRLVGTSDSEYGLKSLLSLLPRVVSYASSTPERTNGVPERARELLHILCEMLNYRLTTCNAPYNFRMNAIIALHGAMGQINLNCSAQLYWALEQTLLRQWTWLPCADSLPLANSLLAKQPHGKLPVLLSPNQFAAPNDQSPNLYIAPELIRAFLLTVVRAIKITGGELASDIVVRMVPSYPWPAPTVKLFPPLLANAYNQGYNGQEQTDEADLNHLTQQVNNDYLHSRTLNEASLLEYFTRPNNSHTFLCVMFRMVFDDVKLPAVCYKILGHYGSKVTIHLGRLVDYVVTQLGQLDDNTFIRMVGTVNAMIWRHWLFPFDRFVFTAVMRHTDENRTALSLYLVDCLLNNSPEWQQRVTYICTTLPANRWLLTTGEWFIKLREYYQQFTEKTWMQMYHETSGSAEPQQETDHLPVYYSNLVERMLPISDVLFHRALEFPQVSLQVFPNLLDKLAPCYRFHPQPGSFLYTTLYYFEPNLAEYPLRRRDLVMKINASLEDTGRPKNWLLTTYYLNDKVTDSDQTPSIEYFRELVVRVIDGYEYAHRPPAFAEKDWRFAEFPNPASQALYGACVEMMGSLMDPATCGKSLIAVAMPRCASAPSSRNPFSVVNAVALILTALPPSFHQPLYEEIGMVLVSPELAASDPNVCFSSFERDSYLMSDNKIMAVLALAHAFWQHATVATLSVLPDFVRERLVPLVENETQLIYMVRLVVPFLQRFYDQRERTKQVMDLVIEIYRMLAHVNDLVAELKYEDTLCDLLYHLKYMYVGDFVKNEAESIIIGLRPSIQEKLRFITHQPADAVHQQATPHSTDTVNVARQ